MRKAAVSSDGISRRGAQSSNLGERNDGQTSWNLRAHLKVTTRGARRQLAACGIYTPYDTLPIAEAAQALQLLHTYGAKYALATCRQDQRHASQVHAELDETLRVIGHRLYQKPDDPELLLPRSNSHLSSHTDFDELLRNAPWKYVRGNAIVHDVDIVNTLSTIRAAVKVNIEHWTRNVKPNAGKLSLPHVKQLFAKCFASGFCFMETDKNLGPVLLSRELAYDLHAQYLAVPGMELVGPAAQCYNNMLIAMTVGKEAVLNSLREIVKQGADHDSYEFVRWITYMLKNEQRAAHRGHILPRLRLLIKLHKVQIGKMIPTRPIIPASTGPWGPIGEMIAKVLAAVQLNIPWIVKDSDDFIQWLMMEGRGRVQTFDFSNLFGSEKVEDTLYWLHTAIHEYREWFQLGDFAEVIQATLTMVDVPELLQYLFVGLQRVTILELVTAATIKETVFIVPTNGGPQIYRTAASLAMGAAPVCPVSNIVLAAMERKKLGLQCCMRAIKRFVDDIAMDRQKVSEAQLKACYPPYLVLNEGTPGVFLDVCFRQAWVSQLWSRIATFYWPHLKEPLPSFPHFSSCHRSATKRAILRNEIRRLAKRTNLPSVFEVYKHFALKRFERAGYPSNWLRDEARVNYSEARSTLIIRRVGDDLQPIPQNRNLINHIQTLEHGAPPLAAFFRAQPKLKHFEFRTAWKVNLRLVNFIRRYWYYVVHTVPYRDVLDNDQLIKLLFAGESAQLRPVQSAEHTRLIQQRRLQQMKKILQKLRIEKTEWSLLQSALNGLRW